MARRGKGIGWDVIIVIVVLVVVGGVVGGQLWVSHHNAAQSTALASKAAPVLPKPPQQKPKEEPGKKTTQTAGNAEAGKEVYAQKCQACHGTVSGSQTTGNPPLSASVAQSKGLDWIKQNMPLGQAGSLSGQQYADVYAFLLTLK